MLKFWVKKDRLHFTRQWMTPEKEMVDDDLDDALARLALADKNLNDAMVKAIDARSYWNNWGAGLDWGRVGQTGTELHRLGGLPRAVSSVKQKGWFADVASAEGDTLLEHPELF